MEIPETKARPVVRLIFILAIAGILVGWFAVGHFWPRPALVEVVAIPSPVEPSKGRAISEPAAASVASVPSAPGSIASSTETHAGEAPRFDVVRVGPEGRAVIAGQAQPGAEVVVRDGSTEIARTRADVRGSFVALPSEPLPPGGRELALASRSGDAPELKGNGTVVLVVPEKQKPGAGVVGGPAPAAQAVVAVLVPVDSAPRVLQESHGAGRELSPELTLDRIDYDEKGALRFTGAALHGSTVRVYVDNGVMGDTEADDRGRWSLMPSMDIAAGMHSVRVDVLGAGGRVAARVELPFQRSILSTAEIAHAGDRVVVQPGQNLWRLARAAYGRGVRYTVIYLANREQIRDPRLIYPGQLFSVPGAPSAGR